MRLALHFYSPVLCNYVSCSSLLTASAKQKTADGGKTVRLKIWWWLEEAVAQYAFLVCRGLHHMLWLARKKTARWDVVSLCQGRWRKKKKAVIRGCILDCIRKLDFRLINVPQHQGRAHTAAGVVEECRAGLRQCKHSSSRRCNQWSHLILFGTLIDLCFAASLRRQTKVSESKPSPNHQVRHTADNSYVWGKLTCHETWWKLVTESIRNYETSGTIVCKTQAF